MPVSQWVSNEFYKLFQFIFFLRHLQQALRFPLFPISVPNHIRHMILRLLIYNLKRHHIQSLHDEEELQQMETPYPPTHSPLFLAEPSRLYLLASISNMIMTTHHKTQILTWMSAIPLNTVRRRLPSQRSA